MTTAITFPVRADRTRRGDPWHLSVLPLAGHGRHGGTTGAHATALPTVPGSAPLDGRWLALQALPDPVVVSYLAPLLAHLVARTLPAWRTDEAVGTRATMAEVAALHALLDELLSQAGPVARQILAYQAIPPAGSPPEREEGEDRVLAAR